MRVEFRGQLEAGIDGTVYVDGSPVNGYIAQLCREAGYDIDDPCGQEERLPAVKVVVEITANE